MGIQRIPWDIFQDHIIPHLHVQDIHSLRIACKGSKAYTDTYAEQRANDYDKYLNTVLPERRQHVWFICAENDQSTSYQASVYSLWICIDIRVPFLGSSFEPFTEMTLAFDVARDVVHVYKPGDLHQLMNACTTREIHEHMSPSVRHCLTSHAYKRLAKTKVSVHVEWASFEAMIMLCCSNGWSYERVNNYMVQAAISILEEDMQCTTWHKRKSIKHNNNGNAGININTNDIHPSMTDVFLLCSNIHGETYDPFASEDLGGACLCELALGFKIRTAIYDAYVEIDSFGRVHILDPERVKKDMDSAEKTIIHGVPGDLISCLYAYYIDSIMRTDLCHIHRYADYDRDIKEPGKGIMYLFSNACMTRAEFDALKHRCTVGPVSSR